MQCRSSGYRSYLLKLKLREGFYFAAVITMVHALVELDIGKYQEND